MIDKIARVRGEWAVQADDIGFCKQTFKRHILCADGFDLLIGMKIVTNYLATETKHNSGEANPDFSSADDSYCFAENVKARKTLQREV